MDMTGIQKVGFHLQTLAFAGLVFFLGIAPVKLFAQQAPSELDQSLVMQNTKIPQSDGALAEELQQVIDLELTNASIEHALEVIAQKANLKLMYSKALLVPEKKVTLHSDDISLNNALWQ